MNKGAKSPWIFWYFLVNFKRYSLTILLSMVLVFDSASATLKSTGLQIAQQPTSTPSNGISPEKQQAYVRGQQLYQEAVKLQQQGTMESRKLALAKYEEALKIWQQIPDPGSEATTRHAIGVYYYTQNQPKKALEYLNQALEINRQLNNRLNEAYILISIGSAYSNLSENQKAIDNYNQALTIFRAEKKHSEEADVLASIGQVYFFSGKTQEALKLFNQVLAIQRGEKNSAKEASTLEIIGTAYTLIGERKKALEYLNQALNIYRTLKNFSKEADILSSIGTVYGSLGEPQESRKYHNQALKIVRENGGDLSQQARILSDSGFSYDLEGDYQKELEIYNQARQLFHQANLPTIEAFTLSKISLVYARLGEKQKALESLSQAQVLHHAVGDRRNEANVISSIGEIRSSSGEFQKALNLYNEALDLHRAISDLKGEANTLRNIASVYKSLGAYQPSIVTYNKALLLLHQTGNSPEESGTLSEIGTVYEILGDDQKSLEYYNQALLLARKVGDHVQEIRIFLAQGRVYSSKGKYQEALNAIDEVLKVSSTNHLPFEAVARNDMGTIYIQKQEYPKALESFKQALSNTRLSEVTVLKAKLIRNIGSSYYYLKQPEQAINNYNQALSLYQALGDHNNEVETLFYIAVTERDRGNLQQSLTQIQAAIKIIEDLRTKVDSQDLRTSYFASQQKTYKFYIDLLMQLHKQDPSKGYNAEALHASESSRARGLIELLTEAKANIRKDVDPKLLAEEKDLQLKIEATVKLLQELSSKPQTETAQQNFKKQLETLLNQQKELETKIRTTNPKYGNLKYPQPLKLPQIQQQLDKDTLLLEYSLGEERSYLWAVTPNSIDSYELPKREEIEEAATEFRKPLIRCQKLVSGCQNLSAEQKAQDIKQTALAATKLSKIILAPVADKLAQKRLVIVADGGLQTIPFAALNDVETRQKGNSSSFEYQPLIVNHEIVNLPSVTTVATQRQDIKGRKTAPKTLAILADPVFEAKDMRITGKSESIVPDSDFRGQIEQSDLNRGAKNLNRNGWQRLEGTRKEAERILNIIPSSNNLQAFGFDANYNWITNKQLSQYRFLHFATHGFADPNNPELSGIVLSLFLDKQAKPADRGYLRLGDIFNLDFAADLVVLSACETGLGKDVNGEGLVGLTRGLMYAGAERVAVSLWQVNDDGTAQLMQEFYTQMLKQGKSPAVALRAAQRKLWQDSKWQNPYYWSAFTLQGEWR